MKRHVFLLVNPRKKIRAVRRYGGTYSVCVTTAIEREKSVTRKGHQRQSVTLDVGDTKQRTLH